MQTNIIYQIRSLINEKVYVGSSIRYHERELEHLRDLRGGKHHSIYLQRAWNKYKESNFVFEILEEVEHESLLIEREQYWIDFKKCCNKNFGYNMCPIAGRSTGYKHSDEVKRKISLGLLSSERIYEKGWKRSEESKLKTSETLKALLLDQNSSFKIKQDRLHKKYKGEGNPNAKLSNSQIIEIKQYLKDGKLFQLQIAEIYGVTRGMISRIKVGKAWNYVT